MPKRSVAYVGYTTVPRENWEHFAPPVKAPSNYKNPDKIREYEMAMRDKQFHDAGTAVMQCELKDLVIITGAHKPVALKAGKRLEHLSGYTHVAVIGASLFRHVLITEQFEKGGKLAPEHQWLVMSLRSGHQFLAEPEHQTQVFDPVHAILCTTTMDDKLPFVAEAYDFDSGVDTAEERARFAQHLCQRIGI